MKRREAAFCRTVKAGDSFRCIDLDVGKQSPFFLGAGLKDFIYIYLYIDSFGLHFQLVCAWFIADLKDSISIFLMSGRTCRKDFDFK